jgi:K(+)-stimulated pyrophosphate-energized sodium pump
MFNSFVKWTRRRRTTTFYLAAMAALFGAAFFARPLFGQTAGTGGPAPHGAEKAFEFFSLFREAKYTGMERGALLVVLLIAIAGLVYALMLVKQVKNADRGTKRMQDIAAAVREGADAYLAAQFRKIGPLILIITVVLYFTTQSDLAAFKFGRAPLPSVPSSAGWSVLWECGWPPPAISGSPRPPLVPMAKPCSSATAPARSPACSPTASACSAAP